MSSIFTQARQQTHAGFLNRLYSVSVLLAVLFEAVDGLAAETEKRANHVKIQNDRFGFLQPSCIKLLTNSLEYNL